MLRRNCRDEPGSHYCGKRLACRIVETEAYRGPEDKDAMLMQTAAPSGQR